jgi:general secretion pathway protein L
MISVGIDIGTYSIKVAEVESTSKSYVVRRVLEFPLSLDLTKDKKIEIIDTLRNLFAQYDPDQTQFVFALPVKHVSARLLQLPFRERFKVQRAIISQLEDELPFSQDDAIFDAKIVRFAGKGADILAMAAPIERVKDVIDLARDCGVDPLYVSTEANGISNLFERWMEPPAEGLPPDQEIPSARSADLVLNIGHTSTEMLVYADNVLVAMRNIDWGAKNIADAIGAKYGLNYLQAMRELQSKGFVMLDKTQGTKEQAVFSQVIEDALAHFAGELRLIMLELQSEMNLQWTKGILLGGGSQLKNLGAFLTQSFEIPFNRHKQFEHHPAVSAENDPHLELVSGAAVGLALEGLRRPRNPASNFMKGPFAQQSQFFESLWDKWGHAAQLAGVAFVVLIVFSIVRENLAASLAEKSDAVMRTQAESIAGIKSKQASPGRINKFIANQEKLEKSRKSAEKVVRMNSAMDVLNRISASLPAKQNATLEIKRVSITNDSAEVQGYVDNENQHVLIRQALQKAAMDGKVENAQMMIKAPSGKVGFAYRFRVDRYTGG